jgi:hypothetical protein
MEVAMIKFLMRFARNPHVLGVCAVLALAGCATYTTPGAGVSVGDLSQADGDVGDILKRRPAASFPARLAVVRVQASGYSSLSNSNCHGSGRYCVLTTRDIESEADFERLAKNPMVSDLALMNRILVPTSLQSTKELRLAAAALKADLVLLYTMDTGFRVESTDLGPLALVSLGFFPNKKAIVTSTASAALYDVRSGFLYGVAEATARQEQRGTVWSSSSAVDNARMKAEAEAFVKLVGELEKLFTNVSREQAKARPAD